jgi:hypothetical protein
MSLPATTDPAATAADLRAHLALCEDLLSLAARESQALSGPGAFAAFDFFQQRRSLLSRLDHSLQNLRKHRQAWQQLGSAERARHPEMAGLLRANQDLIMRILMLERENEQALLRRGLVPPRHLPSVQHQRPHYVADLYRRHAAS